MAKSTSTESTSAESTSAKSYLITASMVGEHLQGTVVSEESFKGIDVGRLLKLGSIEVYDAEKAAAQAEEAAQIASGATPRELELQKALDDQARRLAELEKRLEASVPQTPPTT